MTSLASPATPATASMPCVLPHRTPRPAARWALGAGAVLALLLATVYLAVCAYVALQMTKPERRPFTRSPEQYGLSSEDVGFVSRVDRVRLDGWLVPPQTNGVSVTPYRLPVVIVHGKGTDRQREAQATVLDAPAEGRTLEIARHLAARGHPVLLFDLRGSGRSGGDRFTLGAHEVRDVLGAVDFLETRGLTADGVHLLGFSMGASSSLMAAAVDPRVRTVVDDSGYATLSGVLELNLPRETGLPAFVTPGVAVAARYLLNVRIQEIRPMDGVPGLRVRGTRLLVIHGDDDRVIPPRHGREIAAAYGPGVETWWVSGAGHVGSYKRAPDVYLARLTRFLD